ncbi:MAG TPA: DUF2179 domain-containing protein [Eubacteriaceae bacterium]|nr:DUF2179 domain-containing protein [Eubacteriaceae bacterium]
MGYLLIFFARLIDVPLTTIRLIMIVKGRRIIGSIIGFFEIIVYTYVFAKIVNTLNNPFNLFFYALGFSAGNILGSLLEERIGLGSITALIIPDVPFPLLTNVLRQNDFGVTVLEGEGMKKKRQVLLVILERKKFDQFNKIINEVDPDGFVTFLDNKSYYNGFVPKAKRK